MFCPKCGSTLPDGASFCGKCGNRIAAPASAPSAPGAAPSSIYPVAKGGGVGASTILKVVAVVAAVAALVFAFLPWLETSSTLQGVGSFGSAMGQLGSALSGKNYNLADFDEAYSAFGFMGLGSDLTEYFGKQGAGAALVLTIFFVAWLVGVALLAISALVMLASCAGGKRGKAFVFVIVAAILMAIVAFAWVAFYGTLVRGSIAAGSPTNAIVCGVVCVATVIVAALSARSSA